MRPILPWSYSRLSTYEKCPAKLKFSLSLPRGAMHPAAQRGTDVHATVEDFLTGASKKLHEVVEQFRHVFEKVRNHDPFVEHKIAVNEKWKLANWDDCWGRAVIDAAYIDGDSVEILEWKTGRVYEDHQEQRKLYLLFSMVQWPAAQNYRVQTYYFDQGKKLKLEMEKDDVLRIKDDFNARISIMAGDDIMAPRPGEACRFCDYSRYKSGPCSRG